MDPAHWRDRDVFVTGHTGFKGAWLSRLLQWMDIVPGGAPGLQLR